MNYRLLLLASLLAGGVFPAHAWGPAGHEIVGRIAENNLTPAAARAVHDLLNTGETHTVRHLADSDIVNWPDEIRQAQPEIAPWHFVDIPFNADRYDPARDCPASHGCIVEAIGRFRQVLADTHTNAVARVEALKFLAHFVADIHMPLHCAERHGDKGGNMVWVRWPGEPNATRLHAAWDINLVEQNLRDAQLTAFAYADRLNRDITAAQRKDWSRGLPADWAWESHRLAVTDVYAGIPDYGPAHPLDAAYITKNQRLVAEQLAKAGIRLAHLLNEILK